MHPEHIELRKLRHVVTLARVRSFVRAAKELNLTQPALTRSIQSVEQRFSVRLFDRDRSGVYPTLVGEDFVRRAEALLRESTDLTLALQRLSVGEQKQVSFGMAPLPARALLPTLMSQHLKAQPGLRAQVPVRQASALMTLLASEEIEFFVASVAMLRGWQEQAEAIPLGWVPTSLLVRTGHPLLTAEHVSENDYDRYPLVSPAEVVEEGFPPGSPFSRGYAVTTGDHETLLALAQHNDAIWLSSRIAVEAEIHAGLLTELALPARQSFGSFELMAFTLKRRTLSPLAQRIVADLRTLIEAKVGGGADGPE